MGGVWRRRWTGISECRLADPYELIVPGASGTAEVALIAVRIVAVSQFGIELKVEDFGDISADVQTIRLPFPAPAELRARTVTAVPLGGR